MKGQLCKIIILVFFFQIIDAKKTTTKAPKEDYEFKAALKHDLAKVKKKYELSDEFKQAASKDWESVKHAGSEKASGAKEGAYDGTTNKYRDMIASLEKQIAKTDPKSNLGKLLNKRLAAYLKKEKAESEQNQKDREAKRKLEKVQGKGKVTTTKGTTAAVAEESTTAAEGEESPTTTEAGETTTAAEETTAAAE